MQIYIDLKPELSLRELNKLIDQLATENLRHNINIAFYRIYIRSLGKNNGIFITSLQEKFKIYGDIRIEESFSDRVGNAAVVACRGKNHE
jgi:hypothetical protein